MDTSSTHTPGDTPAAAVSAAQGLPSRLQRQRLLGQLARFGVVGVLNTVVDFALLNLLHFGFGWSLLAANTVSVAAGIVNSFVWNKQWTFAAKGWDGWWRQFVLFLVVSGSALLVNDIGIAFLHLVFGGTSPLAVNLQKLGASLLSMSWNFVGYRYLAFRPRPVAERG